MAFCASGFYANSASQSVPSPTARRLSHTGQCVFPGVAFGSRTNETGRISTMNRVATALSIAAAFAAGCGLTHYLQEAIAAEPMKAQIIHTGEMEGDALGAANKVGFRSKMFAAADGATVSIQD